MPFFCGPIARTPKSSGSMRASALAHPGVQAVLTGEDARAAGFKSLPNVVGYPGQERAADA